MSTLPVPRPPAIITPLVVVVLFFHLFPLLSQTSWPNGFTIAALVLSVILMAVTAGWYFTADKGYTRLRFVLLILLFLLGITLLGTALTTIGAMLQNADPNALVESDSIAPFLWNVVHLLPIGALLWITLNFHLRRAAEKGL